MLLAGIILYLVEKNIYKRTIVYTLNGKKYRLLVADNNKEWLEGLMYHRQLENADGMIFIFPDKAIRYFWNKNTYLDLDVYWIDEDKIVGKDFLPSIEKSGRLITISSQKEVNKVVELVTSVKKSPARAGLKSVEENGALKEDYAESSTFSRQK